VQPARLVVDSRLRCPPGARLLHADSPCTLAFVVGDAMREKALLDRGARLKRAASDAGRVDLAALLADLARDGVREILAETGPTLAGALLEAGLVDELLVYQAASVLGDSARGMFGLPPLARMEERLQLECVDRRQFGDDIRITYRPARPGVH
jgi:diaminohydroxyphosphoribosylaminopyrimidine deaminase/5-amino-6-(5-phosphoribosylamino)uracil reductase